MTLVESTLPIFKRLITHLLSSGVGVEVLNSSVACDASQCKARRVIILVFENGNASMLVLE